LPQISFRAEDPIEVQPGQVKVKAGYAVGRRCLRPLDLLLCPAVEVFSIILQRTAPATAVIDRNAASQQRASQCEDFTRRDLRFQVSRRKEISG
jgi:hypothetical protein